MKIHSILNGGISLVLEPETLVEEELLKALTKQRNTVTEVRSQVTILNKTIKGAVLICRESDNSDIPESKSEIPNS